MTNLHTLLSESSTAVEEQLLPQFWPRQGASPVRLCAETSWVYLLASHSHDILFCGTTSDLVSSVRRHKEGLADCFTRQHGIHELVWYEAHESMSSAIARTDDIRTWNRLWILEMIEHRNQDWHDLSHELIKRTAPQLNEVVPTHQQQASPTVTDVTREKCGF